MARGGKRPRMIASGVVGPPTVGQEGPEIFTGNLWQQCRKSRQNVAQVGERFDLVPGQEAIRL